MHIKYYEKYQQFTSIKTNFNENLVTSIFSFTKQLSFNNRKNMVGMKMSTFYLLKKKRNI